MKHRVYSFCSVCGDGFEAYAREEETGFILHQRCCSMACLKRAGLVGATMVSRLCINCGRAAVQDPDGQWVCEDCDAIWDLSSVAKGDENRYLAELHMDLLP